jgi:hypothetical protein
MTMMMILKMFQMTMQNEGPSSPMDRMDMSPECGTDQVVEKDRLLTVEHMTG